jgi:hypothetical protein
MAAEARDILLYARLVDLHRRKTEAEMKGQSTVVFDALMDIYRQEIDEIEAARQLKVAPFKAAG